MSSADEEIRAAEYRAQQRRQAAFRQALLRGLAGSPLAVLATKANWQPVMNWLRERETDG